MGYISAILEHPGMTDDQRSTMRRLVRAYGVPFSFSVAACSALPTWQNIGTVSISVDGHAIKIHNREDI